MSNSSLEEGKRWLANQIAKLQHDLGEQEQKTTEAQSTLLKCDSEKKHLIAEIARISEENNVALLEAAKKHAVEKEVLQSEMELCRTEVSACMSISVCDDKCGLVWGGLHLNEYNGIINMSCTFWI